MQTTRHISNSEGGADDRRRQQGRGYMFFEEAIHRDQFPTPIGTFDVTGRPIEWTSRVFFRFKGGRISETWVARDELGILRHLGIVLEARK